MLNRRALFAIPAVAALLSIPHPAAASSDDQFKAWDAELHRCFENANRKGCSDETTRRWMDRAHEIEAVIMATPATTRRAHVIKCRLLQRICLEQLEPDMAATIAQIASYLEAN